MFFIAFFIAFTTEKILPASIALALRFALPACSLLFVPYYRFFLPLVLCVLFPLPALGWQFWKGVNFPLSYLRLKTAIPGATSSIFICPFSFSFSPLPSVLRVLLLPFQSGNLRQISTLQVLSVLQFVGSALMARLLRWLRGWQKATRTLHLSS